MRESLCFVSVALLLVVIPAAYGQASDTELQAQFNAMYEKLGSFKALESGARELMDGVNDRMIAFDKGAATMKDESVSVPGTGIVRKITYTDKDGNVLTEYLDGSGNIVKREFKDAVSNAVLVEERDPSGASVVTLTTSVGQRLTCKYDPEGNILMSSYYDPSLKTGLAIEYGPDGKATKITLADENLMRELIVTNNAAGGSDILFRNLLEGTTLSTSTDAPNGEGNFVAPFTPGTVQPTPPTTHWCPNTGQWETTQ